MKPLKLRESQFIDALFRTTPPMNGAEAARMVGVSVASCRVQAKKWLTKSNIQAEIEKRRQEIEKKAEVTREQWMQKMQSFYYADVRKMFVGPGQPVEISELGDHEALLVEGFEVVENFEKVGEKAEHVGYTRKVKVTQGLKRLIEFGKVMGWYTEKKELSLDATLEELVLGSMKEEEGKS